MILCPQSIESDEDNRGEVYVGFKYPDQNRTLLTPIDCVPNSSARLKKKTRLQANS